MKGFACGTLLLTLVTTLWVVPLAPALGQDTTTPAPTAQPQPTPPVVTAPAVPVTPAPAETPVAAPAAAAAATPLPFGVGDVVKLSQSQVSDDVILSYIHNSGRSFSLSSEDIVQLRKEGVSERVIDAMLEQHAKAVASTPQPVAAPAPATAPTAPAAVAPDVSVAPPPAVVQAPPANQPAVEAPLTPPPSSTYPAPDGTVVYPYPYYYPYAIYGGPVVSFRFGFGGHGHYHHWH